MARRWSTPNHQLPTSNPAGPRELGVGSWVLIAALALAGAACGKKGPPLAPFVRLPAAVETIAARRIGGDVYVTLTIPAVNVDASVPPSVQRVEVYGVTASAPPARGRFLERGARIAVIDVPMPAEPGGPAAAEPAPLGPGAAATIRDTLTADELVIPADAQQDPPEAAPRRFYMALAFSDRGPSPPGTVVEVPLAPLPDPPTSVQASYTADTVVVAWQPPGGVIAFLLERALPIEAPPRGIDAPAPPAPPPAPSADAPALYNVYRDIAPDPLAFPVQRPHADALTPPAPLNRAPIPALTFSEPVMLDERQRCYTVRTVRGVPPAVVESQPSARECVTPIDVFPPEVPARLDTIVLENAISLIWEANTEPDLGGYVVFRGEAGGDTLAPLTREPITEAQFTDETVMPGVRYVYHVVAVDRRVPLPNPSAPAIIEVTAR